MIRNNTGVLLLSHGSSLPYGEITFKEIKDKFNKKSGLACEVGYMKVSSPSIAGAIDNLKDEIPELNRIIALPVFLAPGIHTNIDIPILLGLDPLEIDPRCPDGNYPDNHYLSIADDVDFNGSIELLSPIGADDDLLLFINKRINDALYESELDSDAKTGILLVSHGSRLKYNKEFISELFNKFKKSTNYSCNFGFMELVKPSIPEAIDKLVAGSDIERLIVIPVFIAPGVHTTHDIPTILGLDVASHNHDRNHHHHHDLEPVEFDGEILYSEPIGGDDILIDILIRKVKEIL